MAPLCTCGHSKTDHLTGRCVNRRTRFDASTSSVVVDACSCKKFSDAVLPEKSKTASTDAAVVEESEAELSTPPLTPTKESDGTAPPALATAHAPSTKTTAKRRDK